MDKLKYKTRISVGEWEDNPEGVSDIIADVDEFILIARTGMDLAAIGNHSKSFGLLAINEIEKILQEMVRKE